MSAVVKLSVLDAETAELMAAELGEVLADCVNGGASVNFMLPYDSNDGAAFFRKVASSVARGDTILVAARVNGRIVGTVQLGVDMPPNQPHRADVKKLLVHRSARNAGVGNALMECVETIAKEMGRTLLVLDTASDSAERLYARRGWQRLGVIPDFALWPAGGYCDTIYFWKKL